MLTYPATVIRDDRAAYRPYRATVKRVARLTPHFVLVTFAGPEFAWFGTDRRDQRIKILFPLQDGTLADVGIDDEAAVLDGSWYRLWRELPAQRRSPFRTYTVRDVRPEALELDVVFVDHGLAGPAARWLSAAEAGQSVIVVGPDVRSSTSAIGIDWHPGDARELLLAGDETAAPAICAILEALPAGVRARAFVEVPSAADRLPVDSAADVELEWLARDGDLVGSRLEPAVRAWVGANPERLRLALAAAPEQLDDIDVDVELLWDSPVDTAHGFYAWLAGESAVIKSLRRFLVGETGIDRASVAFMGYWRLGKSEAQE